MIVTVVGVTDVQTLGVTVSDVVDTNGNTAPSVTVNAVFLLGDVVGDRMVIESDLDEVRSLSHGPALSSDLIRGDVDVDGGITRADGALVRANLGQTVE